MSYLGQQGSLRWFFSDRSCASFPEQYRLMTKYPLSYYPPFGQMLDSMGAGAGYILSQTHSTSGYQVDESYVFQPSFTKQGDYLITNIPGIALGVLTADCVPVIIYDPCNMAVATIHAGWRGAVGGIVGRALEHMRNAFNTDASECTALLGPSAKVCCYQVQKDFLAPFSSVEQDRYCSNNGNSLYFDLPTYVLDQLRISGVEAQSIDLSNNSCTIHSTDYCSFRRDGLAAGRQISCAVIVP